VTSSLLGYNPYPKGAFMKKRFLGLLILLLTMIILIGTTGADADWVKGKWHGPGGVIYLHTKGHLITSWNGNSYFPTSISGDAAWVEAKWHGPEGVIYLHTKGHLITSWNGHTYFPTK
jgi:hypothetical protein